MANQPAPTRPVSTSNNHTGFIASTVLGSLALGLTAITIIQETYNTLPPNDVVLTKRWVDDMSDKRLPALHRRWDRVQERLARRNQEPVAFAPATPGVLQQPARPLVETQLVTLRDSTDGCLEYTRTAEDRLPSSFKLLWSRTPEFEVAYAAMRRRVAVLKSNVASLQVLLEAEEVAVDIPSR